MKKNYKILVVLAILVIGGILAFNLFNKNEDILSKYEGQDVVKVVEQLENDLNEPEALQASITPDQLILSNGERELIMPTEQFYLSIAPYIDGTHECFTHNLITCRGELVNEEMKITFVDDGGKEIYNETNQTFNNGFYGIWLPKNISGTISVEYDGKKASQAITTTSESPTCITTLKLT